MSELKDIADRLVERFGNQEEAARQTGVSATWFSRVRRGEQPTDVKSDTWRKLYSALGEECPGRVEGFIVRESASEAYGSDQPARLAAWLRKAPEHVANTVYAVAGSHGFSGKAVLPNKEDQIARAQEVIARSEEQIAAMKAEVQKLKKSV